MRIKDIRSYTITVSRYSMPKTRHSASLNQKKLYYATYIHNYISTNNFSNIQAENCKNRTFYFYSVSTSATKRKNILIIFPARKVKIKKLPNFMRGKRNP